MIQPHEPYENTADTYSEETRELISIMKETRKWKMNSKNDIHPFLNYLNNNDHKDKGRFIQVLPNKKMEIFLKKRTG